jgi:hypothetical protein
MVHLRSDIHLEEFQSLYQRCLLLPLLARPLPLSAWVCFCTSGSVIIVLRRVLSRMLLEKKEKVEDIQNGCLVEA